MKDRKQKRKNFRLPLVLSEWVEKYAKDRNTTVTQLIIDHFTDLRRRTESSEVDQF